MSRYIYGFAMFAIGTHDLPELSGQWTSIYAAFFELFTTTFLNVPRGRK